MKRAPEATTKTNSNTPPKAKRRKRRGRKPGPKPAYMTIALSVRRDQHRALLSLIKTAERLYLAAQKADILRDHDDWPTPTRAFIMGEILHDYVKRAARQLAGH